MTPASAAIREFRGSTSVPAPASPGSASNSIAAATSPRVGSSALRCGFVLTSTRISSRSAALCVRARLNAPGLASWPRPGSSLTATASPLGSAAATGSNGTSGASSRSPITSTLPRPSSWRRLSPRWRPTPARASYTASAASGLPITSIPPTRLPASVSSRMCALTCSSGARAESSRIWGQLGIR